MSQIVEELKKLKKNYTKLKREYNKIYKDNLRLLKEITYLKRPLIKCCGRENESN